MKKFMNSGSRQLLSFQCMGVYRLCGVNIMQDKYGENT